MPQPFQRDEPQSQSAASFVEPPSRRARFDLAAFRLQDMMLCSTALRRLGEGAASLEEAAGRITRFLYTNLTTGPDDAPACVLVRAFKTHPYARLTPELQALVDARLGHPPADPGMPCLTLLGSTGAVPGWNDPAQSSRFRVIPLAGPEALAQLPMFAQLFAQFQVEVSGMPTPSASLLLDRHATTFNAFHVPHALHSPYVPGQQDFVIPFGVHSVFGCGGLLPTGDLFALVLFATIPVATDTADLFKTLALSVKLALAPFEHAHLILPTAAAAPGTGHAPAPVTLTAWHDRVATLEALLTAQEQALETQARPLNNEADQVAGRIGMTEDMAERKQAEEALRTSEARFRQLANTVPVLMWVADTTKACIWFNDGWLAFTGRPLEQEYGNGWADGVHPDDFQRCLETYVAAFDRREPFEMEYRLRRHDGSYRWLLDRGAPQYDAGGVFTGYIGGCIDIQDRRDAAEALQQIDERWQFALEGSGDGVWDWNAVTDRVHFSPRWKAMLGYAPHEIGDRLDEWSSRIHPDDLDRTMADVQRHLRSETPVYVNEHRVRCKDGSYKWILDRGKVMSRAEDGRPLRVVGTHTDIARRKLAEQALRASKERYQGLVDSVDGIVWEADAASLRFTFVSAQAERILGYPLAHWREPDFWLHHMHPDDRTGAAEFCLGEIRAGRSHAFEYRMRAADGRMVWLRDVVSVAQGPESAVPLRGIMVDVTDRKAVEEVLRESEERFRLVAEATNDVLWDWDLTTNRHWWSPNVRERFGCDPAEETTISAWVARLHPDDRATVLTRVDEAARSDARTFSADYRMRLADGTYGHFIDRGHIVRDETGRAVRMIGAMIDVTLSRQAYVSLETAYGRLQSLSKELQTVESNERRRLSRELHDEVGQLLTGLKFDLEAGRQALNARRAGSLTRARERIARSLDMTDQLFARLRRVVRALRPPVLEELGLKDALGALATDLDERTGLRTAIGIDEQAVATLDDPSVEAALYRMAQELMTNVSRHAEAASLTVTLAPDRHDWVLTVRDDGKGFDPAVESITGMGLRGIRERAEILGGQVAINSAVGQGATVTIRIPAGAQPRAAPRLRP